MKKRNSIYVVILILLIIFAVASFSQCETKQEKVMAGIDSQQNVIGTSIGQSVSEVQKAVESGAKSEALDKVLREKDGYVCALNTSSGPMALRLKGGKIREDMLWGNADVTSFIIGNYAYRYSSQYGRWLRFDYAPDMKISANSLSRAIMSESELLNVTSMDNIFCIKSDVPDSDFQFPIETAVDVSELIRQFVAKQ